MLRLMLLTCLMAFAASPSAAPQLLVEGWVRLGSGEPVVNAQVAIFDLANLRQGAVAYATTDAAGYFALSVATPTSRIVPQHFALGQNYPNPFNPSTIIPYELAEAAHVRLEIFNLLGQRLATLVDGTRSAGSHTAMWDATDAAGRAVGAGVYIYRMSSEGRSMSRRMVLVDGQAGVAADGAAPVHHIQTDAVGGTAMYGLTVAGAGLVAYVDPEFRVGMGPVDLVVEAAAGVPRGKVTAGGILGDVDNNNRVDFFDALIVALYSNDSSTAIPNNGDISLGDVNQDGQVDLADAYLIAAYLTDPSDPSLPAGIGDEHGDSLSEASPISLGSETAGKLSAGDEDYFVIEMTRGGILVAYTTGDTDTYGSILNSSGSVLTSNDEAGPGSNFRVSASVGPGTYYIRVRGYGSLTAGSYTLYADTELGHPIKLTNSYSDNGSPSWSPDGSRLAFVSDRDSSWEIYDYEIYVMDADGQNQTRLTDNDYWDGSPSWSPDGSRLAFVAGAVICVMDADGQNQTHLTDAAARDGSPSWSPDGSRLAFASDRDGNSEIYVMDADGQNQTRLPTDNDYWDGSPSWSPDGSRLAFVSDRDGDGNSEIYVMDADGQNQTRLTDNDYWDGSPSWSPDGSRLAFASDRDGNSEIYVMDADGQNQTRLTQNLARDGSPSWSPDGSRLAFVSDRDGNGNSEIYVMDANGESIGDIEDLIRYEARYNAVIYYDAMTLINTLVSSFRDALAIALVSDEVDLPEAGGGTLKIAGNTWTLQDYSPGGPLVLTDTFGWLEINGTLDVAKDQFPTVPVVGTVETSSPSSTVTLDIVVDASGAELSITGTVTIEDVDFDIAEILAAAEFGFLLLFE